MGIGFNLLNPSQQLMMPGVMMVRVSTEASSRNHTWIGIELHAELQQLLYLLNAIHVGIVFSYVLDHSTKSENLYRIKYLQTIKCGV